MANQKQYPTFVDFKKGGEEQAPFGVVIANVTRDIELRNTNSGKAVASTGVAVNLGAKHLNYVLGTSFADDETIFIEATGWEKTAEIMQKANITKGSQVAFSGTLAIEEFNGKTRVRMNVSRFQIIKRKGDAVVQNDAPATDVGDDDLPF
jgi:single-stranded DNA-binding protein